MRFMHWSLRISSNRINLNLAIWRLFFIYYTCITNYFPDTILLTASLLLL